MTALQPTLLKIGDVARQTDMTLRTLRYYEELDLIGPANRSKGNFRLYHPQVIQRVKFIHALKKLGFSLDEIRSIIGTTHMGENDMDVIHRTREALRIQKETITAKLIEMADMNREVDLSLSILDSCMACQHDNPHPHCDPACENKHAHL